MAEEFRNIDPIRLTQWLVGLTLTVVTALGVLGMWILGDIRTNQRDLMLRIDQHIQRPAHQGSQARFNGLDARLDAVEQRTR